MKNTIKTSIAIFLIFILPSCNAFKKTSENSSEEEVFKKKRINPNVAERARESADKGGGIFNSSRKSGSTTYEFATSNILWRASLKTIDFMPLSEVDYSGGVLSTDWYSKDGSDGQIKITIRFLSNELSTKSIKVISHKKNCSANNCTTTSLAEDFNFQIEEKILQTARNLMVEEEKAKKK